MKQYAAIDDVVYFWFGANDTSGSGGDGASPAADVRLAGAAPDAAPVYSPTPSLLSHANYPAGAYEIAIIASVANGFAADSTYAVFCTLAIDSQNPTGFVGSFDIGGVYVECLADAALAQINIECDTALTDYDPPTRTEATSDKNELVASLDTIKGLGWVQTSHSLAERPVGGAAGGHCAWYDDDLNRANKFFKASPSKFKEILENLDSIKTKLSEVDSDSTIVDSISKNNSTMSDDLNIIRSAIAELSEGLKITDSLIISIADAASLEELLDEA